LSAVQRSALAAALALLLVSTAARAADAEDWTVAVTPYILLPGVDAELGVSGGGGGSPSIEVGPTDFLALVNFAAMLKVEARQGRGFTFVDWMYLDLGDADSMVREIDFPDGSVPIGVGVATSTDMSFDGYTVALGGGWRFYDEGAIELDAYGGLRTLNLSASLRWTFNTTITSPGGAYTFPSSGLLEDTDETWDAMVGLRGRWDLGDGWRAFGAGDHAWGHETESWQWSLGVSKQKGSISLELAWREIGWAGIGGSGAGKLRLHGPALGATFRF
jgi:hypothetical protein